MLFGYNQHLWFNCENTRLRALAVLILHINPRSFHSLHFLSGWMRFKNKCFLFKGKKDDIKANWTYARSWCREQGGDLAVIDNQYENSELLA